MIDPHFQQVFSLALGISEPWFIKSLDLVPSEKNPERLEMRIAVDYIEGTKFRYGGSEDSYPVHDTRERTWRHLNFFQYRCYITARVPRIILPDGKVRTVDVPWGRDGSGFTLMMEGVILSLMKHMPVSTVAREIGEHDTRIWRVLEYHVEEALKQQDFSDVTGIGVDEYSHRGHNYITVFVSHPDIRIDEEGKRHSVSKPRVLFTTEGKDKGAVSRFLEWFIEKKGNPEAVKVATSDMIHGFRNAMNESFPNSVTTVDKFHVVSNCEDALDRVRRREAASGEKRKYRALAKTKYLWLKNGDRLTDKQKERLDELLQIEYLDTVKAYDMRLRLQDFYASHDEYDEKTVFDFECMALDFCNSTIHEIQKFGEMLVRNAVEILNYFETKRTNAILEGFNSKISIIKNRARGFRNMKNFMAMIYFCCGELDICFQPIM
ncbi:MAG: ISL3 family transposase [Candidatus Cryptobacteroides sp.]